ncbi:class I SAM-dependent methyltransferase [bacterium]|nr:class I SAM-dependent methyltransferase [bacterium]
MENVIVKSGEKDFFKRCLEELPLSLSIIRSLECKQFDMFSYKRPILDIGCGDGLFSKFVFAEKTDFGIDLTLKFLKKAKINGAFLQGCQTDASLLPFKKNSFNSVVSNCVVEHIIDVDNTFKEVARILKPEGSFVFTTHTHLYNDYLFYSNLFYKLKLHVLGKKYEKFINSVFKHKNCLHPDTWSKKLEDAGFSIDHISHYYGEKAQKVFDFLVPFTFFRFLLWNCTGKWFLLRKNLLASIQYNMFKHLYRENPTISSAIVIKAIKK